jgi:glycosyltransferase involved in cell wall biosynthesis
MPCLNGARFIRRSIESVLAQTLGNFELLIIDNGSTDNTLDVVSEFTDFRIRVLHQPLRGVSLARNLGLKFANSPLIAFLDSDDTWRSDFLERMTSALREDPNAVLAYCGWQNEGLVGARGLPFVPPDYEVPEKMALLLEGCRWPIHGCLTRHNAIKKAGGFNTHLVIGEDYLLWLEVSAQGLLVHVPEVMAQYHHHGNLQATQNRSRAVLDTYRAKRIFLNNHPEIIASVGEDNIANLTWGKMIEEGNALHWKGDIESCRPVFRKLLLSGKGTAAQKLRMLPSLLPLSLHKSIISLKTKFSI